MDHKLAEISTRLKADRDRPASFVMPVSLVEKDGIGATIHLCTGSTLDIPASAVMNITDLGIADNGRDRFAITGAEIDRATETGRFLHQAAREIHRLSNKVQKLQASLAERRPLAHSATEQLPTQDPALEALPAVAPFDRTLPSSTIKIPFWGTAGNGQIISYVPPFSQYIAQWKVSGLVNCFMTKPPFIEAYITGHPDQVLGIMFYLEAAHGTPLYQEYFANLVLQVVLVQQTT